MIRKIINADKKDNNKFVASNLNYGLGPFSFLFGIRKLRWRILISLIVGVLMSLCTMFFIQNTGLYTAGLSGIFQGISRIIHTSMLMNGIDQLTANFYYNLLFYGLYLLSNLPLLVFSYFKIGKNFTLLSFIVILLQNTIPILLGLIPGANTIMLFGNTQTSYLANSNVVILTFSELDINKFGSMVVYGLFASLISGISYALALVVSGSTGGLDFISIFYSIKKCKPIGFIIMYFNMFSIIISIIIGTYIPVSMSLLNEISPKISPYSYELFFSQNLIMSTASVLLSTVILNVLFPKNKIIKVSIYSDNIIEIRNKLYNDEFHHSITIYNTIGGYSLTKKQNADIICLYIELPKLLRKINEVDKEALVAITHIIGINGKLNIEKDIN